MLSFAKSGVGQNPVAEFSANVTSGCGSLVVEFTDLSTNNPHHWKWELGNGTIIQGTNKQNIVYAYTIPGIYSVTLTSTNTSGSGVKVKTAYIHVFGLPVAQFNSSPNGGCNPLTVQFTNQSTVGPVPSAPINSWIWDFGNGNSSNQQNPTHTYSSNGNYNVTLEVKDGNNCTNTIIKNSLISVSTKPIPSFTVSDSISCTAPFTVNFNNTTTGVTTYQWDFGNGSSSTLANPTHTYTSIGSYTVKLIVGHANGCRDSIVKLNHIQTGVPPIDISINPSSVCIGTPSLFSTNTPNLVSATWDFGNGMFMTGNPVYNSFLTGGNYNIKLTVQTLGGCFRDTIKTITVHPPSTIGFTANAIIGCDTPHTVTFTHNTGSGTASDFFWDFGDGNTSLSPNPTHTYSVEGEFTVFLTASDANGCGVMENKPNYIKIGKPIAGFYAVVPCTTLEVSFFDTSYSYSGIVNWKWDFGDGNNLTNVQNPQHLYAQKDTFWVSLIITNGYGCKDTAISKVFFPLIPVADFIVDRFVICHGAEACFKSLSINADSLFWIIGNKTILAPDSFCTKISPLDTGYFPITLIAVHGACQHVVTKDSILYILPAVPKIYASDFHSCTAPLEVTFNDSSILASTTFWDFGEGTTSILPNPPPITYTIPDNYEVKLIVTNNDNGFSCIDSSIMYIQISGFGISTSQSRNIACPGDTIAFDFRPDTLVDNLYDTYGIQRVDCMFWDFGNLLVNIALLDTFYRIWDTSTVYHVYNSPGFYTVMLIAKDAFGCRDTTFNYVHVLIPPSVDFSVDNYGCAPVAIQFNNLTTYHPPATGQSWVWCFGDGSPNSLIEHPVHLYSDTGKFTVKLIAIDSEGCKSEYLVSDYIDLSLPVPDFLTQLSTPTPFAHCGYDSVFFNNSSLNAISYNWDLGDGTGSTAANPIHLYNFNKDSLIQVILTSKSANGCEISITKEILIIRPQAEFTADNLMASCPPLIVSFENLSLGAGLTYSWDFGDPGGGLFNNESTLENPVHTYALPGKYDVLLQIEDTFSCKGNVLKPDFIEIFGPKGDFNYSPKHGCPLLKVNFAVFDTANLASVRWVFGDGSDGYGMATSYFYPEGQYTPAIQLTDPAGCVVTKVGLPIEVYPDPLPDFAISDTSGCTVFCIEFNDLSTISSGSIINWQWVFSDGDTVFGKHFNKCFPNNSFQDIVNYSVGLKAISNKGCFKEKSMIDAIKIYPKPIPEFDFSPKDATAFNPEVNFYNYSSGNLYNHWNFGFGQDSSQILNPVYSFTDSGSYLVSLTTINQFGCVAIAYEDVFINGGFSIYIPNAFTPNEDGLNERFSPIGYGLTDLEMTIYNRWGQAVYNGSGLSASWDGTINGKMAQQGVYFYSIGIKHIFSKGEEWQKFIGQVSVIR
jgi:gliding motility-associated-like protein